MISFFLRTKHWILFILSFLLPMIIYIMAFVNIFLLVSRSPDPDPSAIFGIFKVFPFIFLPPMIVLYGWFYSVGMGLKKYLPPSSGLNHRLFQVLFWVQVVMLIGYMLGFMYMFNFMTGPGGPPDPADMTYMVWFLPFQFLTLFISLYLYSFCAQTIKQAETQYNSKFSDALGEFFLVWFFPIGIWFLQPRINKIVRGEAALGGENPLDSGI